MKSLEHRIGRLMARSDARNMRTGLDLLPTPIADPPRTADHVGLVVTTGVPRTSRWGSW